MLMKFCQRARREFSPIWSQSVKCNIHFTCQVSVHGHHAGTAHCQTLAPIHLESISERLYFVGEFGKRAPFLTFKDITVILYT